MDTFTVVDNIWLGEGFHFVLRNLQPEDAWKYGVHQTFYDIDIARSNARELNRIHGCDGMDE